MITDQATDCQPAEESALLLAMAHDPYAIIEVARFCRHKYVDAGGDVRQWWARLFTFMGMDIAGEDIQGEYDIGMIMSLVALSLHRPLTVAEEAA